MRPMRRPANANGSDTILGDAPDVVEVGEADIAVDDAKDIILPCLFVRTMGAPAPGPLRGPSARGPCASPHTPGRGRNRRWDGSGDRRLRRGSGERGLTSLLTRFGVIALEHPAQVERATV